MLTRVLLQDYKADVDSVDFKNNTALHYAVLNTNIKVVKILLQKFARIDIENFDGQTVLKLPLRQEIKIVLFIIKKKIYIGTQ